MKNKDFVNDKVMMSDDEGELALKRNLIRQDMVNENLKREKRRLDWIKLKIMSKH